MPTDEEWARRHEQSNARLEKAMDRLTERLDDVVENTRRDFISKEIYDRDQKAALTAWESINSEMNRRLKPLEGWLLWVQRGIIGAVGMLILTTALAVGNGGHLP